MRKRVFVGLPLSPRVAELAGLWQNRHGHMPVRWLEQKNLHITLVPPWQAEDVPGIVRQLENVRGKKTRLEFSQIEFGPRRGEPRQIWVTGRATRGLLDLRGLVFKSLDQTPGGRPFLMHITLARLKPVIPAILPESINWQMNAEKFVLYESVLGPEGADYRVLGSFTLE